MKSAYTYNDIFVLKHNANIMAVVEDILVIADTVVTYKLNYNDIISDWKSEGKLKKYWQYIGNLD